MLRILGRTLILIFCRPGEMRGPEILPSLHKRDTESSNSAVALLELWPAPRKMGTCRGPKWQSPSTKHCSPKSTPNPYQPVCCPVATGRKPTCELDSVLVGSWRFANSTKPKIQFVSPWNKERYPHLKDAGDWCPLPKQDVSYQHQLLLEAEAGDLILWGENLFFFIFFKIFCFIFSFIFFFNFLSFWFGRQAWL